MPRLIDADALIPKGTKVTDDVIAVHNAIKNAPTIEAEPVRYGRWMCGDYYDIGDVCSECDWDSLISPCDYRYCPNCGAKMDGGADDVSD